MKVHALAARLLAIASAFLFSAAAAITDYSDLWWNPLESGWGVGLQQQGDVIFLTLFVYGPDGSSTWFVAPSVRAADAPVTRWQGPLYRVTGPAYSAAYDGEVQAVAAGSVTLDFAGSSSATFAYTVDGLAVSKQITRMTWREPSAAGTYYGGFTTQVAECADPTRIGAYDFLGSMSVTHSERQLRATITSGSAGVPSTCTFSGATSQAGRLSAWSGTFNCTFVIGLDGRGEEIARTLRSGTFTIRDMSITAYGFHGALTAADQDCAFSGRFGATRLP